MVMAASMSLCPAISRTTCGGTPKSRSSETQVWRPFNVLLNSVIAERRDAQVPQRDGSR